MDAAVSAPAMSVFARASVHTGVVAVAVCTGRTRGPARERRGRDRDICSIHPRARAAPPCSRWRLWLADFVAWRSSSRPPPGAPRRGLVGCHLLAPAPIIYLWCRWTSPPRVDTDGRRTTGAGTPHHTISTIAWFFAARGVAVRSVGVTSPSKCTGVLGAKLVTGVRIVQVVVVLDIRNHYVLLLFFTFPAG